MTDFSVRALDSDTWADFADLAERHKGVWGGCWCMSFHSEGIGAGHTPEGNREAKERRVRHGTAHAALVYHSGRCVGWCQYGPRQELPRIKNRREYERSAGQAPDWRITCFFVDRDHRGQGVAQAALEGAMKLIAQAGGGVVESYPDDPQAGRLSASFLHNATVAMFLRNGFVRDRQIGKTRWVVRASVQPADPSPAK